MSGGVMTIERLRVILDYSKSHSKGISEDIESFCHQIDISNLDGIRDVLQIVRPYILRKNTLPYNFRCMMMK